MLDFYITEYNEIIKKLLQSKSVMILVLENLLKVKIINLTYLKSSKNKQIVDIVLTNKKQTFLEINTSNKKYLQLKKINKLS